MTTDLPGALVAEAQAALAKYSAPKPNVRDLEMLRLGYQHAAAAERAKFRALITPQLLDKLVGLGAVSHEWSNDVADLLDGGDA